MAESMDIAEAYIAQLPSERQAPVRRLWETIRAALPDGFEEALSFGMIGFVIPRSLHPAGYHANPAEPVPFISLASQKRHIALYHMGLYLNPDLVAWFKGEYPRHARTKLDMAKSCIRFHKLDDIPYELVAQLCGKISPADYLEAYKRAVPAARKSGI